MSTEIIKKNTIFDLIEKSKGEFEKALPAHVRSEKFMRTMLTELRTNQALQKCEPLSIVGASMQAAGLGLEIGSQLGLAYLIPYGKECRLTISYKGLVSLCLRSGEVLSISAAAVHENDEYDIELGTSRSLTHKPKLNDRGKEVFYYATAKMKSGETVFEYMTLDELTRIEKMSKGNIWKQHRQAMCKKSVIKKLIKLLPISTDFVEAVTIEDSPETRTNSDEYIETTASAVDKLNQELLNGKQD